MKSQCSVCESEDIRPTKGHNFAERKLFPIVRLWPFQCRKCQSRFYRFSFQNGDGLPNQKRSKRRKKKVQEEQFPGFFDPPDDQGFKDLIAEIAAAEKKIFGNQNHHDVDLSGNHNQDFQEEKLKAEDMD